jgi:hypothetical protein
LFSASSKSLRLDQDGIRVYQVQLFLCDVCDTLDVFRIQLTFGKVCVLLLQESRYL